MHYVSIFTQQNRHFKISQIAENLDVVELSKNRKFCWVNAIFAYFQCYFLEFSNKYFAIVK